MKIAVIGHSGSGKSTLATRLGAHYSADVMHLDQVNFTANWKTRPAEEAQGMVLSFLQKDSWVIDGNYTGLFQKERMEQADSIVFLDFDRLSCLVRVLARYRKYKGRTREDLAEGCPEKIDAEFIWWVLYAGRTKAKRRKFAAIVETHREKITVIRNQKQLDVFYAELEDARR